jgi:hypothetical protein
VHPVVVTGAAIAAVGVADTLLEAAVAAALLPAAVVIPLEEITAAITKPKLRLTAEQEEGHGLM